MKNFQEIKEQAKRVGYALIDVSIPGEMTSIQRMLEIQVRPDDKEMFYYLCDDSGRSSLSEQDAKQLI